MRRRDFIALIAGGASAWPLTARAQQPERMRRIGVLMSLTADDPDGQVRRAAFLQGLQRLGWTDGRNVRIDTRWGAGDADRSRIPAAELVALAPDLILASGTSTMGPLLRATRTIPIVFTQVTDPVGAGFVDSLARPGGNATGFTRAGSRRAWARSSQTKRAREATLASKYTAARVEKGSQNAVGTETSHAAARTIHD